MADQNADPAIVDKPDNLNEAASQVIPEEPPPVSPVKNNGKKWLMTFVIMAITVPLLAFGAMNAQTLTSRAARKPCAIIWKVNIHPGEINTYIQAQTTGLSVLAYDVKGNPISYGVNYDWGISSANSVGTLKARKDLAEFIPLNEGVGDMYVKAKNSCTKKPVIGSIKVYVNALNLMPPLQN